MNRVLLISQDRIGTHMAGPGVRYVNMARVLSNYCHVTLALPQDSVNVNSLDNAISPTLQNELGLSKANVVTYNLSDWQSITETANTADVIVFPIDIASIFTQLATLPACLVVDGYDPLLAEWLALYENELPDIKDYLWRHRMSLNTAPILMGDFFICASQRQRDWWLGMLEAHGRINLHTYKSDPSLHTLIDLVPFGLTPLSNLAYSTDKSKHDSSLIKIVWAGGLWPWLDPITAIDGFVIAYAKNKNLQLLFPGTKRPNSDALSEIASHFTTVYDYAQSTGLLGKAIVFGEWVPYADWQMLLHNSHMALTCHYNTLETRLAYRSRMLDLIAAEVPIISTGGDATSDLITQYDIGITVPYRDPQAVANAILHLADHPIDINRFAQLKITMTWEHMCLPLIRFCQNPRRAADRVHGGMTVGNPYYNTVHEAKQAQNLAQLTNERDQLQTLVHSYEAGKVMRLMKWLSQLRHDT